MNSTLRWHGPCRSCAILKQTQTQDLAGALNSTYAPHAFRGPSSRYFCRDRRSAFRSSRSGRGGFAQQDAEELYSSLLAR